MQLNYLSLGKRIRTFRKKAGLSQSKLAEKANISSTYMSYIENGMKCVSLETLINIANALHTSADDLLRDSLENTIVVSNHEFVALIADCNEYELRVLLEAAGSIKDALRNNKHILSNYYKSL